MEAIIMNENKKELVENEMEKVTGGKFRHNTQEMYLSDEDKEKVKKLENERYGYTFRGCSAPDSDRK
jgi:hypothetical protein